MALKLHNFFRSSTSTRVRAALNLKGLSYDYVAYVLRDGETRTPEYLVKNPQGLVPTLEREDGSFLTQSLAILEWLEEAHPQPPLLPADTEGRMGQGIELHDCLRNPSAQQSARAVPPQGPCGYGANGPRRAFGCQTACCNASLQS